MAGKETIEGYFELQKGFQNQAFSHTINIKRIEMISGRGSKKNMKSAREFDPKNGSPEGSKRRFRVILVAK